MGLETRSKTMTRILIADDQPIIRTALGNLIGKSGEDWQLCGVADNGRAAVEQAAALKPDLVVLDMRMPQMDGIAAGRAIRAILPSTPVLIYTLFDAASLERTAREAGLQGVVQKSRGAEILQAIREALRGNTVFGTGTTAKDAPDGSAAIPASGQRGEAGAAIVPMASGGSIPNQQRNARMRRWTGGRTFCRLGSGNSGQAERSR
jgi:DNA-binding NarL/FixJ family response regulator